MKFGETSKEYEQRIRSNKKSSKKN